LEISVTCIRLTFECDSYGLYVIVAFSIIQVLE
jgi:hypothetical protein